MYTRYGEERTLFECSRNIFHELGHALGLHHNFKNGPAGEQCDECEDNGCPTEGTSNNLMDYWPSYGGGISACQLEIIRQHLKGLSGNIADVLINDSCFCKSQPVPEVLTEHRVITGTQYLRNDLVISDGAVLEIRDTLSIGHNLAIQIESGGRLELRGGTLTNLCGDLWGGIHIAEKAGAGSVVIEGAHIEHARVGVLVTGNIDVDIKQSVFSQCPVAVRVQGEERTIVNISNSEFIFTSRFNRYEEGVGPQSLIECDESDLTLTNCLFINEDRFLKTAASEAGDGVRITNSRLHASGNVFRYLTTGIRLIETGRATYSQLENNTFDFCAVGVISNEITALRLIRNNFIIYRFNDYSGIGFYSYYPGYAEINQNSFRSEYGGAEVTGVVIVGNRSGTQVMGSNQFANLNYGIIQQYANQDPDWLKDSADKGLGLVLDVNQYAQVSHTVLSLTPDGYGLTRMNSPPRKDVARYQLGLNWPIGGLTAFLSAQPIALTLNGQMMPDSNFPQHNFFINLANDSLPYQPSNEYMPDVSYSDFRAPVEDLSSFTVEHYLQQSRIFSDQPEVLRDSEALFGYIGDLADWPVWAVGDLIRQSEASSRLDQEMSQFIRKRAKEQLVAVFSAPGSLTDLNRPEQIGDDSTLPEIPYPELVFRPGVPSHPETLNAGFKLYPNPARDLIHIMPTGISLINHFGRLECRMYDIRGRLVDQRIIRSMSDLIVPLNEKSPGLYWMQLSAGETFYGRQKFIILRSN